MVFMQFFMNKGIFVKDQHSSSYYFNALCAFDHDSLSNVEDRPCKTCIDRECYHVELGGSCQKCAGVLHSLRTITSLDLDILYRRHSLGLRLDCVKRGVIGPPCPELGATRHCIDCTAEMGT